MRGDYGTGCIQHDGQLTARVFAKEAGGQGRYYALDAEQGDSASIGLKTDPSDRNLITEH